MTWTVHPSGPVWEKIVAHRADIEAMVHDCVPTHEIARRIGVELSTLHIYRAELGLKAYPSHIVKLANIHPELKPVLWEKGQTAFQAAVAALRKSVIAGRKARARNIREHATSAQQQAIAKAIADIAAGKDRNVAIREARDAGAHLEQIGKAFGLTRERIRQLCNKTNAFGLGVRQSSFDHASIAAAYEAGLTQSAVAKLFHCSPMTVSNACRGVDKEARRRNIQKALEAFATAALQSGSGVHVNGHGRPIAEASAA